MKRTDMLSKIASVIINYNEAHRQTPREVALEMAETILQIQKEVGMLPPPTQKTTLGQWEPDDELP